MSVKKIISLFLSLLILSCCCVSAFATVDPVIIIPEETVVEPTPQPTETPAESTAVPTAAPEGVPTPEPTPTVFQITKSPSGETKAAGSSTYFSASANNATSVSWIVKDGSGNEVPRAQWVGSGYEIFDTVSNDNGKIYTELVIKPIASSLNGWSFQARFLSAVDGLYYSSNTAVLYVTGTVATPQPSSTPVPTASPVASASPTPVPTPVPTAAPSATPVPSPTISLAPIQTFEPIATVDPSTVEVQSGNGMSGILLVVLCGVIIAVGAVLVILASSGMLGGGRRRRRR